MHKALINKIIAEALRHTRQCSGLISFRLKLQIIQQTEQKYDHLFSKLKQSESSLQKTLLQYRAEPPILTCEPIVSSAIIMTQLLQINDEYHMITKFQRSQQWINDVLRQLNQQQIEQKQLRKTLINLRNNLQEFTEQNKGRIVPSLHHKIVDLLI